MARDTDALKIEKWAASGDVQDPEDGGVDRATGWDATHSQPGGSLPKREHFNQILRELTAQGVEVNVHGLLEWDSRISYVHPALVFGSDDNPYISLVNSTNVDPVTDSAGTTWKVYGIQEATPDASTTVKGVVELATAAETQTGTDATRAVTPAGLASLAATEGRAGLVERASQSEADTGTDTSRYMTPAHVKRRIDQEATPDATTTVKGKVELATNTETQTGTDSYQGCDTRRPRIADSHGESRRPGRASQPRPKPTQGPRRAAT